MMKKWLSALLAMFVVVATFSFAKPAEAADKMKEAVNEQLAGLHYDYKKDSVKIHDVETVKLAKPTDAGITEVKIGIAEFNTYRDGIFYFDNKDFVYYDTDKQKAITYQEVAGDKNVEKYRSDHKGIPVKTLTIWPMMLMMALILIVPGYLMTVWLSRQYSVTDWKTANNLHKNQPSYK